MKLQQPWPLTTVATLSIYFGLPLTYWYRIVTNFTPELFHNTRFIISLVLLVLTLAGGIMLLFGSKKSIILYGLGALLASYLFIQNFPYHGLVAVWNNLEGVSQLQANNLKVMALNSTFTLMKSIVFFIVVCKFSKYLKPNNKINRTENTSALN